MFRRVLKYGSIAAVTGTTIYSLSRDQWDLKNIGLIRFGRAAATVGTVAIDYKYSVRGLMNDNSDESIKKWSDVHQRSAQRLLELCCTNGGVFIKVGQHIGALEYLAPPEYVNTLKVLHSRAPKSTLKQVKNVIKQDLGNDAEDLFEEFYDEPIGAASLAQVHKAKLKDGRIVAVKVQHPKVKHHSMIDIATMNFLVNIVARIFPEFSFLWLAEETKRNLPVELDFVNEGKNAERISRAFIKFPWLKIPEIFWELSSPRVLVMEYVEGFGVTDRKGLTANGISCREVSQRLGILYSEMIFLHGNVHCDPHPGNILIRKSQNGADIVLLDHGLYTQLTEQFRHYYSRMWLAVLNADIPEMKRWANELGVGDLYPFLACIMTAKPWESVTRGIGKKTNEETTKKERGDLRKYASQYFVQIAAVLSRVDRQMLLVFKTNDLLRSIDYALGTSGERTSLITMSRCCVRAVHAQQLKQCRGWYCRLKVNIGRHWIESKLTIYSFYLWFCALLFGAEFR